MLVFIFTYCWATTESWKNVSGVRHSPGIFCKQEAGNPEYLRIVSHSSMYFGIFCKQEAGNPEYLRIVSHSSMYFMLCECRLVQG